MAAIGTTAKLFRYTPGNELTSLTAEYIDANWPQAQEIRDVFATMKSWTVTGKPSTQNANLFLAERTELTLITGYNMRNPLRGSLLQVLII